MVIFLTGSSGFIGSNITLHFLNHTVCHYNRDEDIKFQLDSIKPDWIINCAAEIYDRSKMWESNVLLVKSCLDWIVTNSNTKMIHIGSSSEYGPFDCPTSEKTPAFATDMYGTSKAIATQLCKAYAETYKIDVLVVRPYSLYGPFEKPHRLFPKLWQAFKLDRPMQLVQGVHDFCYIDDFVNAVEKIMSSNNRIPGDVVNISSGIQTTNQQVLEHFRSITNTNGAVTVVDKFCTPKVWQADISYAFERYGWSPSTSLEEGIKQFLDNAYYE